MGTLVGGEVNGGASILGEPVDLLDYLLDLNLTFSFFPLALAFCLATPLVGPLVHEFLAPTVALEAFARPLRRKNLAAHRRRILSEHDFNQVFVSLC